MKTSKLAACAAGILLLSACAADDDADKSSSSVQKQRDGGPSTEPAKPRGDGPKATDEPAAEPGKAGTKRVDGAAGAAPDKMPGMMGGPGMMPGPGMQEEAGAGGSAMGKRKPKQPKGAGAGGEMGPPHEPGMMPPHEPGMMPPHEPGMMPKAGDKAPPPPKAGDKAPPPPPMAAGNGAPKPPPPGGPEPGADGGMP